MDNMTFLILGVFNIAIGDCYLRTISWRLQNGGIDRLINNLTENNLKAIVGLISLLAPIAVIGLGIAQTSISLLKVFNLM